MLEKIKNLFKKQEVFPCIVWDGKSIKYLDLTQKEIKKLEKRHKEWVITKKEECF